MAIAEVMQSRTRGHASLDFYTGADSRVVDQTIYFGSIEKTHVISFVECNFY
jgi:hypothetical protein